MPTGTNEVINKIRATDEEKQKLIDAMKSGDSQTFGNTLRDIMETRIKILEEHAQALIDEKNQDYRIEFSYAEISCIREMANKRMNELWFSVKKNDKISDERLVEARREFDNAEITLQDSAFVVNILKKINEYELKVKKALEG